MHHDYIATTLRLILAEAGARPFPKEVMLRSLGVDPDAMPGRKSRLDVGAVGLPHMQTELYDIRISDPTQEAHIDKKAGACAAASEAEKERKYAPACRSAGHRFFPFVSEL